MQSYDKLMEKWAPVLNESSAGAIKDNHRRAVTAAVLENQEKALRESRQAEMGFMTEAAPAGANTGSIGTWDPVLISLVRRSMPNLMAYDVCGVQPMSGPTGLIFAMKARYGAGRTNSTEALFNEANTGYSGDSSFSQSGVADGSGLSGLTNGDNDSTIADSARTALAGHGMPTADAEALGTTGGSSFGEMGFTIEKATVTAKVEH